MRLKNALFAAAQRFLYLLDDAFLLIKSKSRRADEVAQNPKMRNVNLSTLTTLTSTLCFCGAEIISALLRSRALFFFFCVKRRRASFPDVWFSS
jgi:hypothetical protein